MLLVSLCGVVCRNKEELNAAFVEFKAIADQKKVVTDADLEALMDFSSQQISEDNWILKSVYVTSGARGNTHASVPARAHIHAPKHTSHIANHTSHITHHTSHTEWLLAKQIKVRLHTAVCRRVCVGDALTPSAAVTMIDPDGKEHTDGQCAAYTPAQPHLLLLCPHNVSLSLFLSLCVWL